MILEGIFKLIKLVLHGIISLIPDFSNIALPDGFMEWFVNTVKACAYFLPLGDMFAMFGIWMVVVNFNIVWKIIQRIWDAVWP